MRQSTNTRQPIARPPGDVVLDRYELEPGQGFGVHVHDTHQLTWAAHGVLRAEVAGEAWVLPPTQALWIPRDTPHDVVAPRRAQLACLYVHPDASPIDWPAPTVVAVSPLIRELLLHLTRPAHSHAGRARAEAVLFDLLEAVPVDGRHAPVLRDERTRAVADALRQDPADPRSLREWGRNVGASPRTLTRLFAAEAGMSFTDFRVQVRLDAALEHLAAGSPVATVAHRVGYGSASAFVSAFRRHFGHTPAMHYDVQANASASNS